MLNVQHANLIKYINTVRKYLFKYKWM